MSDPMEQMFRRGLAELVRDKPALGPVDLGVVMRAGQGRHGRGAGWTHPSTTRMLMAAAALVVVVGVGLAGWFGRSPGERVTTAEPQATTAAPQATTAVQVQGPDQLTGVRWLATRINDQPVRPEAGGAVPYLEVSWPKRVDGGDPCNEVSADYRLDGDQLRFDRLKVIPMSCRSSDQQSAYTSALRATRTARWEGRTLTLLDSAGAVVLVFRAATDPDPAPATSIRVRNDGAVDFARVEAEFPDGTKVDYGPVGAGQSSGYGKVGEAFRRTFVRIQLGDGRELTTQLVDDYAETPLAPGRYSYVLRIGGSGSDAYVDLRLEADQ